LALAARPIVVLIRGFFNRLGGDVGVGPFVQLMPVESHALFPDWEFPHIRANRFVEFVPTHA
jgi:hypothetical protein